MNEEYEVIDIEAEEKLCNELITKEQAFQVIADNNSSTKMTLACYDALLDGIAKAKAIEADPVRHWIPVSKKLPEVRQWVLCQCEIGVMDVLRRTHDGDWERLYPQINYPSRWVIAWMPPPEPYKGEKDE